MTSLRMPLVQDTGTVNTQGPSLLCKVVNSRVTTVVLSVFLLVGAYILLGQILPGIALFQLSSQLCYGLGGALVTVGGVGIIATEIMKRVWGTHQRDELLEEEFSVVEPDSSDYHPTTTPSFALNTTEEESSVVEPDSPDYHFTTTPSLDLRGPKEDLDPVAPLDIEKWKAKRFTSLILEAMKDAPDNAEEIRAQIIQQVDQEAANLTSGKKREVFKAWEEVYG